MKTHILLTTVLGLLLMVCAGLQEAALAQAASIHVSIQGNEIPCPADPAPCPVGGTYAGFTIGNNNGTAQVVATDSSLDSLKLENALITATGNTTTGSIVFWRDCSAADNVPSAPPSAIVRFEKVALGSLVRGAGAPYNPPTAAPYASFTVDGWAQGTEITLPKTKTVQCSFAACGSINLGTGDFQNFGFMTGSRQLKGKASFYLPLSGDQVKVTRVEVHNVQAVSNKELEELGVCTGDECDKYKVKIR